MNDELGPPPSASGRSLARARPVVGHHSAPAGSSGGPRRRAAAAHHRRLALAIAAGVLVAGLDCRWSGGRAHGRCRGWCRCGRPGHLARADAAFKFLPAARIRAWWGPDRALIRQRELPGVPAASLTRCSSSACSTTYERRMKFRAPRLGLDLSLPPPENTMDPNHAASPVLAIAPRGLGRHNDQPEQGRQSPMSIRIGVKGSVAGAPGTSPGEHHRHTRWEGSRGFDRGGVAGRTSRSRWRARTRARRMVDWGSIFASGDSDLQLKSAREVPARHHRGS